MQQTNEIRVNPDKIHLQLIRPLASTIQIDPNVTAQSAAKFNVNFEVGTGISLEANAVKIIIKANLVGIDAQDTPVGIQGEFLCEFILMVENLADFMMTPPNQEGEIVLHGLMAGSLLGICYSTFRGIVFANSKTVLLEGIILPVLDPLKLSVIKAEATLEGK